MYLYNKKISIYNKINDYYKEYQWGLRYSKFDHYFDLLLAEKLGKVKIAIIDSGIDKEHEDFSTNILPGWNFLNNNNDIYDNLGHGTAITGVLAARANNNIGIAGIIDSAQILPIKIIDALQETTLQLLIEALYYVAEMCVDVINISLGFANIKCIDFKYLMLLKELQKAINIVTEKNTIVVAAIGNNPYRYMDYPAACENVIAVGAYGIAGRNKELYIARGNISHNEVIYAPGEYIFTTLPDNKYGYRSGSSLATPFVSGAIAIIKSIKPNITYKEAKNMLFLTADCIEKDGDCFYTLNIDSLIKKVMENE